MLSNPSLTRILAILSLVISFDRFYARSQSCYDVDNKTICYFQPKVASTYVTWEDAWKVCKEYNSTLPVIENQQIEEKLKSFVQSKTYTSYEMWLAGREIRTDVWQWLSGKPFRRHSIPKGGQYETNIVITGMLEYLPRHPMDSNYYICHCTECLLCQNKKAIRFGNGCLLVNNNERLTLIEARNRCLDNGGDLATFEEDEDLGVLQQNHPLLYEYRWYWIGLRRLWWIWNMTDSYKEIKYSNWDHYNNYPNEECLSIYLYNYKWSQDRCSTYIKPFICQRGSPNLSLHETKGFFIALGVIIGVIVVIAVVVIVSLIVVLRIRNRSARRSSDRNLPTESSTRLYSIDDMNKRYN